MRKAIPSILAIICLILYFLFTRDSSKNVPEQLPELASSQKIVEERAKSNLETVKKIVRPHPTEAPRYNRVERRVYSYRLLKSLIPEIHFEIHDSCRGTFKESSQSDARYDLSCRSFIERDSENYSFTTELDYLNNRIGRYQNFFNGAVEPLEIRFNSDEEIIEISLYRDGEVLFFVKLDASVVKEFSYTQTSREKPNAFSEEKGNPFDNGKLIFLKYLNAICIKFNHKNSCEAEELFKKSFIIPEEK